MPNGVSAKTLKQQICLLNTKACNCITCLVYMNMLLQFLTVLPPCVFSTLSVPFCRRHHGWLRLILRFLCSNRRRWHNYAPPLLPTPRPRLAGFIGEFVSKRVKVWTRVPIEVSIFGVKLFVFRMTFFLLILTQPYLAENRRGVQFFVVDNIMVCLQLMGSVRQVAFSVYSKSAFLVRGVYYVV